jgi:hypothetical protein
MAWTTKQKSIAATACKAAGISDDQRIDMILRNFPNAHHAGGITSTSPKLTHHDFAQFMSIVEGFAGGKVLHFTAGYWKVAASDRWQRMKRRCEMLDASLQAGGVFSPGSLAGWISKRVTAGDHDRLDELDYHQLSALMLQLESLCRQRGVKAA